jgi:acyl carrier protein
MPPMIANVDTDAAKQVIDQALSKTLGRENVEFSLDTDLLKDEVLDSLDSVVFVLQLQQLSGREFPQEQLAQPGFFQVRNIVRQLLGSGA